MRISCLPGGFWRGVEGDLVAGSTDCVSSLVGLGLSLRYLKQVHGTEVHTDRCYRYANQIGDGLLTVERDVVLTIRTADCIPLYLWSSGRIALVHAGWRGVKDGIVLKLIQDFKTEDVSAVLGPSIHQRNYQVDADLYMPWLAHDSGLEPFLSPAQPDSSKRYLDLRGFVRMQLIQAGVPPQKIQLLSPCTFASSLPSYRREGLMAGRIINFMYRKSHL